MLDTYAVSVQRDGDNGWAFNERQIRRVAKTIVYLLRADKKNNCTVVVTGEAVNGGDGEGMQVPCTLHFKGHQKFLEILKKELSGKA